MWWVLLPTQASWKVYTRRDSFLPRCLSWLLVGSNNEVLTNETLPLDNVAFVHVIKDLGSWICSWSHKRMSLHVLKNAKLSKFGLKLEIPSKERRNKSFTILGTCKGRFYIYIPWPTISMCIQIKDWLPCVGWFGEAKWISLHLQSFGWYLQTFWLPSTFNVGVGRPIYKRVDLPCCQTCKLECGGHCIYPFWNIGWVDLLNYISWEISKMETKVEIKNRVTCE